MENLEVSCVRSHCALTGPKDVEPQVDLSQYQRDVSESSPDAFVARAHSVVALALRWLRIFELDPLMI